MKTPTIYDIMRATLKKKPYYFNQDTLRCFGQSFGSFTVEVSPKGNIYLYAPSYWRLPKTHDKPTLMGYTFGQFINGDDLTGIYEFDNTGDCLDRIKEYIKTH